jgi:hypothetical protein
MDNTENKKKSTTNKKKSDSKFTKSDGIFFIIICIGLIIFTIILVHKNASKRTFETSFGENTYSTITLKNDKDIQVDVYVDKEQISSQKGEYQKGTETDAYIVDIDDDNIQMNIEDDTLTLIYDDNTSVTYKEKK